MADAALFIGFGITLSGRERRALSVLDEALRYYAGLQQAGELESFEPVLLEPHGGDLGGFILLRGEPAKLDRIRRSAEFQRLTTRAGLVAERIGVVSAYVGEELRVQLGRFEAELQDLAS